MQRKVVEAARNVPRHFCVRHQQGAPLERADPRAELAKAQAPVGLLQLPRSRGERLRHMEIIDRVPFDLVAAYHERETAHGRLVGAAKGPIGKIFRRHRKDSSTTLIHTILKACVEKRWDAMLWDTFADAIRRELTYLGPADIGLVLLCCIKADFRGDSMLVPELIKRLASSALAGSRFVLRPAVGHGSGTSAPVGVAQASIAPSARRHRSREANGVMFPEHALLAGMAAANHFGLGRRCADDLARVAARASQDCGDISSHILCRMVHHAAGLMCKGAAAGLAKFLHAAIPELRMRLRDAGPEVAPADICLIAHAYAHATRRDIELFKAFAKLSAAAKNGNLELFDRLGRQLLKAFPAPDKLNDFEDTLDLRSACVSLNAFAQASLRHEPFFVACEEHLPVFLVSKHSDLRQLAMIAHAYVRVGLPQSCLLPLVWDWAIRLAPHSDAQGVGLMIFAVTKAAVSEASGFKLLQALSSRLRKLLEGEQSSKGIPHQTIAVSAYALAKSGHKGCVDDAVWNILAYNGRCNLRHFSMTEAANLASAFAEVLKGAEETQKATRMVEVGLFFDDLLAEVKKWISYKGFGNRLMPPAAAAKLIVAFGDMKCYEAACSVQELARRVLLPSPQVPLRSVIEAFSKLHVVDEDLMQALTMAQKRTVQRRRP